MTQDNLLSSLRAVLIIIGSYVVGHNIFGHAVDSSTWQIVAGAVVTVASTIWGIASKTTTIEGVESAVRSIITSVGGLFVSAGILSGDNLNAILGLVTALAPAVQSALSKTKTAQVASGQLNAQTTGKIVKAPPKLPIIILLVMIGFSGQAQSIFGSLPKPITRSNTFTRAIIGPFDTIPVGQSYTGFRFQGPSVLYATSFKTLQQTDVFTFLFISFQKAIFDATSQKYYTNWAVALGAGEGGQFAPASVSAVTALALAFSTQQIGKTKLPFLITLAGIYNLTTKQGMPAVGPGIPLNN